MARKGEASRTIPLAHDNRSFNETCYSIDKPCIIAFFDGRADPLKEKNLKYDIKALEKIADFGDSRLFTFIWVNATCQVYFYDKKGKLSK